MEVTTKANHFHREIVHSMVAYMDLMNKLLLLTMIKHLLVVKHQLMLDPRKAFLIVNGHLDKNQFKEIAWVIKQKEGLKYQAQ